MKNDRKTPRMHVVSYLKLSEMRGERSLGRVSDISAEGLRLQASDPIETDTTYEFEMMMPPRQGANKRVSFHGEVVWCQKSAQSGYYDTGIQMVNIPDETCEMINKIIEETPFEQRHLNVHRPRPMEH